MICKSYRLQIKTIYFSKNWIWCYFLHIEISKCSISIPVGIFKKSRARDIVHESFDWLQLRDLPHPRQSPLQVGTIWYNVISNICCQLYCDFSKKKTYFKYRCLKLYIFTYAKIKPYYNELTFSHIHVPMPIFAFTWTILFYKSMPLRKDDKRFYVFVITYLI